MKKIAYVLILAGASSLLAAAAHATTLNLLTNGNFGAGNTKVPAGWSATNNRYEGVQGGPSDPNYYMGNGLGDGTTYLSQTFSDVSGTTYALSYTLYSSGANENFFKTSIDGTTLFQQTGVAGGTTTPTYTFVGTGSDTVQFASYHGGYFRLYDVSVTAAIAPAPEPSSLLLLGTGLCGVLGGARRKYRHSSVLRNAARVRS